MQHRERFVIYSALLLLLCLNIAVLSDGGVARANDDSPGADLGPAQTITLLDDGDELVLRNRDERLAWADDDYAKAYSIAFVHLGRPLGPLLQADEYRDEYEQNEQTDSDRRRQHPCHC